MARRVWFERAFELGVPVQAQPELIERLRGTAGRLEERVSDLDPDRAFRRPDDQWSIAEHAGHLSDLEPLWSGRVEDLLAGLPGLRPADLENRATWAADHNGRTIADIVGEFRQRRGELVRTLEALTPNQLGATALHPRLEQPMTIVDLCFFVAEHDDHHLATITTLRTAS